MSALRAREADLSEILARVEKASGPDRELDVDLAWALEPERYGAAYWNGRAGKPGTTLPKKLDGLGRSSVRRNCPALTASIDAALALVERVLPGWRLGLYQMAGHWQASLAEIDEETDLALEDDFGDGATAPLAILTALLSALRTQETQDDHKL